MAELGQTSDPAALVPGNPDSLVETVLALLKYGELLQEAGAGLKRIDTSSGWSGAAADAFHNVYHGQPGKWLQAGDAFVAAGHALDDYTATLRWGQQQAADAISQWNSGAAGHKAAQDTLDRARAQVASAGDTAADAIGRARDQAPPKPGFWSDVGSFFSAAGHDLEDAGATVVNAVASVGNAAVNDPTALAGVVGGALLTGVSTGGEGLGVVLDATGAGAVAGVPLNALSAAGMVTGASLTAAGAVAIARDAAGPDQMNVMNRQGDGRGGGEPPKSNAEYQAQAKKLGYPQRVPTQKLPFHAHGEPGFTDGKNYLTPDRDGHNTSNGWKLFNRRGVRKATLDWDGNPIKG